MPPTTNLQPGATGAAVQQLQQWLVSQGYLTQAQMNTGPGTYGPATTAAVKAFQQAKGVDNSSGPGYWGPLTIAAASNPQSTILNNGSPAPSIIQYAQGTTPANVASLTRTNASGAAPAATTSPQSTILNNGSPAPTAAQLSLPLTPATILGSNWQTAISNGTAAVGSNGTPTLKSQAAAGGSPAAQTSTDTGSGGVSVSSTGNPQLDQIQTAITDLANQLLKTGYTIPADLQITPQVVSQFLTYAHQAVDPYTQQLISSQVAGVNADLQNQQNQYNNQQAQTIQDFGTQLSSQDNSAGANGVAMSGQRQLNDQNLVNSTNRSLSSLASTAAYNAGNSLRTGAANVGAANANQFNLPTFATGAVGLGGQTGNYGASGSADLGYNPSIYTVGTIPSNAAASVAAQQASYLSQYGTLAGAQSNSGRSINDLMGMISGLPAGATTSLT